MSGGISYGGGGVYCPAAIYPDTQTTCFFCLIYIYTSTVGSSMVVSGCCVFFIALLKNKAQSVMMSCVFSGVSVIGWNALDVIGVELYPTNLR